MKAKLFTLTVLLSIAVLGLGQTTKSSLEPYIKSRFKDNNGKEIVQIIVPGKPPATFRAPIATPTKSAVMMSSVPAFSWSFGCSATAAAMAAGFYDNQGYPNMYAGPTNGGVMPMNNSSWGSASINGETRDLCPLSATRQGLDSRATRGHVDDYWISSVSTDPDPYITNGWVQHTHGDCTGDFMGTNQSAVGSSDGSTTFYYYGDGTPLYDYSGSEPAGRDGCHGLRLFYESRGYTVVQNYTQLIYGLNGNTQGFTFDQYKTEINNGRPVLIQVSGHTMLGYGYEDATQTVYLHDTWDYNDHSMVWGGNYSGMDQWGVTVVELYSATALPIANFTGTPTSILTGETVSFNDVSVGNPTSRLWTFSGGTPATSTLQSPVVTYSTPGVYNVSLLVTNANGSDTEIKTGFITVADPAYCNANAACDEYISNVSLNTINNTSTCGTSGYTDFTSISTTLNAGQSYTLTISNGNPVYPEDQCGAWIDWNNDKDFDDSGEYLAASGSPGSGPYTINFTVPAGAASGNTRLRTRVLYTGNIVSCGSVDWGETEDYTVSINNQQSAKTLNLSLMIEGLYNPVSGQMNKAQDESGNHFSGTIADQISIALANSAAPHAIVATATQVNLDQSGSCSATFSSGLSGSYYIVVMQEQY
ncbi:MAG: PKD domain-containing protein [Bacteroidales bacterium]|nr:PKD domain-containing protein [Bacteroidales bacterium]